MFSKILKIWILTVEDSGDPPLVFRSQGVSSVCDGYYMYTLQPYLHQLVTLYSCPNRVVPYTEELISRPFLDENRFRLVSQDRISAQNAIGYLVFVSQSLFV